MNNIKLMQITNYLGSFFYRLYLSYIPNKKDTIKQIILKILFLVSLITLIISATYLINYFLVAKKQDGIIEKSRTLWHEVDSKSETTVPAVDITKLMLEENSDFKGWISINNTKVDNPIYQTKDNDFYLTHNQKKLKSVYGALFFDAKNQITESLTDTNLVIYGHEMKNGSMFGTLKKFRSLDFYKSNPTISFSTLYKSSTYKIFSVFVLNASKSDDNNYIYNVTRNNFNDSNDFDSWVSESYQRSILNTGIEANFGDNIITLVTCCNDFENARLIIMAREVRDGESTAIDTNKASVNPSPRYPKRWYDDRGIDYKY